MLFWAFSGLGWELGMSRGQFLVVHFLGFYIFGRFWHFLAFFWHFLGFSGGLCIFRILMSYEVTRGVVLVVGRVTDEFWGVQGGFGWVWGVLGGSVLPQRGTFCPSGSLLLHQIWYQTLHNGPTGQCLLERHH